MSTFGFASTHPPDGGTAGLARYAATLFASSFGVAGRWLLCMSAMLLAMDPGYASDSEVPRLPVEAFASLPAESSIRLSPAGDRLASLVSVHGEVHVAVREIGKPESLRVVARTDNRSRRVNWLRWANNDRLLLSVRFPDSRYNIATVETRLLSIDVHSGEYLNLVKSRRIVPQIQDRIVDILPDDRDHILMAIDLWKHGRPGVYRVNVNTAKANIVAESRANVVDWISDRQHRVRVAKSYRNGQFRIEACDPDGKNWRELWKYEVYSEDRVDPLGFDTDPQTLYVRAGHGGRLAIFKVDLEDPDLALNLVHSDPVFDVEGDLLYSQVRKSVIGIYDGKYVVWDKQWNALIAGLTNALPDTNNQVVSTSDDERRYVLFASSSTEPGIYYFGDRDEKTLTPFSTLYSDIDRAWIRPRIAVEYPAADGTIIHGFLTLPAQGGNTHTDNDSGNGSLPAIVLPHGGPMSRSDQEFDFWSQLLANRGYAVLEMNYRGSTGRGFDFMQAGMGNWASTILEDIGDGTRWLIAEGIADPERVCIVGGSFGGYAALMSLAVHGDLYRCAVALAPVTDLRKLLWEGRKYVESDMIEAQLGSGRRHLRDSSPVKQVSDIRKPVLLIHGDEDRVVNVAHSRNMRSALKKAGGKVDYLELADGDHFLSIEAHRIAALRRMDEFLQTHLPVNPQSGH